MIDENKIKVDLEYLAGVDEAVAEALPVYGYPKPRIREAGFPTFLSTIVSQQISTEAAASIMGRVKALLPTMGAAELLALPEGALREAGLSGRKVEYAQGLAQAVLDGEFVIDDLPQMSTDEAIKSITALRGFGAWSAEIYLMFSLQKEDIFPAGDLALRVALQRLHGLPERLTEKQATARIEHWSPCRSVGSLFLWHYYRGAPT